MKTPLLVLAALAATLSGCSVDNYASPEFMGICVSPGPDTTTGACTYSAPCSAYLTSFWYDASYAGTLVVPIEMFNQLPNNADQSAWRVNTNDAVIEEWRIEVGGVTIATASTSLVIPAGTHVVALVPVVPVVGAVSIRAAGRYLDDRTFVTGAFGVTIFPGTYAPMTCTTGTAKACPRAGQEATQGCVTG